MPTKNLSTTAQLNKIIEFRQTAYEQVLTKNQEALFELMDALLSTNGKPGCFAELSQSPVFRRKWSSAYKEGWTRQDWLRTGYVERTKRRNQSNDWLRLGEATISAVKRLNRFEPSVGKCAVASAS